VIRWIVLLIGFGFGCAGLDFLVLAISAAHTGLGIADYGTPLMLGAVLFSFGVFISVKVDLRKR